MFTKFKAEEMNGRGHLRDLDIDRTIILKILQEFAQIGCNDAD